MIECVRVYWRSWVRLAFGISQPVFRISTCIHFASLFQAFFCCSHEGNIVWFYSHGLNQYQYIRNQSASIGENESGMQLKTEIMKCTYCECTTSIIRMYVFDPLNFEGGKGGNNIFNINLLFCKLFLDKFKFCFFLEITCNIKWISAKLTPPP